MVDRRANRWGCDSRPGVSWARKCHRRAQHVEAHCCTVDLYYADEPPNRWHAHEPQRLQAATVTLVTLHKVAGCGQQSDARPQYEIRHRVYRGLLHLRGGLQTAVDRLLHSVMGVGYREVRPTSGVLLRLRSVGLVLAFHIDKRDSQC